MSELTEQNRTETAAPVREKRRCAHIDEEGRRCGRWASRGEELCHPHLKYAEACARSRVDVPVLEDHSSILYVLSQTAQGLATGGMPPANGHAVISACKLATRLLELRLKQTQWEEKHGPISREAQETGHAEYPEPADHPISPTTGDMGHPVMEHSDAAQTDGAVIGGDAPLMAVSDDACDQPFVPAGQRACDRVRARIEAAAAERYAQEGPEVQLPRFPKEDLQKEWERGRERPALQSYKNRHLSHSEAAEILEWQRKHPEIMRAREQHMLDVYFGRVKKEPALTPRPE